jgi:hypothetical protein
MHTGHGLMNRFENASNRASLNTFSMERQSRNYP